MSKLLIAIVHELDAERVISALEKADHRVTMLPSVGGFLRIQNATLLIAAEEDAVPGILAILEEHCSARDVELPLVVPGRLADELPRVVRHGGATVLIGDLQSIVRI